jgi:tetratricopeptide (TPR) repeat protein
MSEESRFIPPGVPVGRKGRPKNSMGVQATLERLTGKTPCPRYLLQSANKYLKSDLFSEFVTHGQKASNERTLSHEAARTLLMNALELDDLFLGNTGAVINLLKRKLPDKEVAATLDTAHHEVSRRYERYAYWHLRGAALKVVMSKPDLDFKVDLVDVQLNQCQPQTPAKRVGPFAMRAMQQLEQFEERGRLAGPNANALAEQAEAYLTLGDSAEAAAKAQRAIELDLHHAKGWFVRVVAALRLRNDEAQEMRRWNFEATEVADLMSAHEAMAHDLAAEAAGRMGQRQASLADLAAQALLHWPAADWGRPAHPEWRVIVKEVFLKHCFSAIRLGIMADGMSAHVINGFGPEWNLKCEKPYMHRLEADTGGTELLFSASQQEAIALLLKELAQCPDNFYMQFKGDYLAWQLELIHLQWVMRAPSYDQQWVDFSSSLQHILPEMFERQILNRPHLAVLWQSHLARNGGTAAILNAMYQWQQRATAQRAVDNRRRLLASYILLYHHQLARTDLAGCQNTCTLAMELIGGDESPATLMGHPFEESISVPAYSTLYWQYLYALAVVKAAYSGQPLSDEAQSFLAQAPQWRQAFNDERACFWICEEMFEDGGGTDYQLPPYDLDLTEEASWRDPTMTNSSKPFTDFVLVELQV